MKKMSLYGFTFSWTVFCLRRWNSKITHWHLPFQESSLDIASRDYRNKTTFDPYKHSNSHFDNGSWEGWIGILVYARLYITISVCPVVYLCIYACCLLIMNIFKYLCIYIISQYVFMYVYVFKSCLFDYKDYIWMYVYVYTCMYVCMHIYM